MCNNQPGSPPQDLGDTKTWQVPQCVDSLLLCKTLTDIKLDRQMASRS